MVEAVPSPAGGSGGGMVLRVRLADGSMEKIQVEEGTEGKLTLEDVLKPFDVPTDASVRIGATTTKISADPEAKNLEALNIKHGSMITVLPPPKDPSTPASSFATRKASASASSKGREWDPYPDLAKDYDSVVRQTKTKRSSRQGMSYNDISKLQSSLHVVDPQKEGPLKRLYMCRVSAERFYNNGVLKGAASTKTKKGAPKFGCRFGLLLGTIQRERVDRRPKKGRTSLSSQTSDSEYCTVAKVQAVWEPPSQRSASDKLYDASLAASLLEGKSNANAQRVLAIAKHLGLVPIGWIFSYRDDRLEEENSFQTDGPQALFGLDVAVAGKLKAQNMKDAQQNDKSDDNDDDDKYSRGGDKFVTLAMDATTGATEAFQLSDVAVQMVHEDMFEKILEPTTKVKNPPMVPMRHAVLVDGSETKVLDSVLCLVNTAVLSHVGSYSGGSKGSAVKKSSGGLTKKTKKVLLRALENNDSNQFLQEICDFNILMALDELLSAQSSSKASIVCEETELLCGLVKKWARGQKQGTTIDSKFKMRLKTYLS